MLSSLSEIRVYQVLTPAALSELQRCGRAQLQPTAFGDTWVLLKCAKNTACDAARSIWCRRFRAAAVVEIALYAPALAEYPCVSVAYEAHREYCVPVTALSRLSAALLEPVRVVDRFRAPSDTRLDFVRRALGTGGAVESFC